MQARQCRTSKINASSDLLSVLSVCDKHRADVLEFFNILQGLIIKHDYLAQLTEMSADATLIFEALMVILTAAAWRLTVSKRASHLATSTAFVRISEVGHMEVGSNLNPCVIL